MKDPEQIDTLIGHDIASQTQALRSAERSLEFHSAKIERLKQQLGCEHRPTMVDSMKDRCEVCGYEWTR